MLFLNLFQAKENLKKFEICFENDQITAEMEDSLDVNIKEETGDFMEVDNRQDIPTKQPLDLQIKESNDQDLEIDNSRSKKDWIKYHSNEVQCYKCADIISKVKKYHIKRDGNLFLKKNMR